MTKLDQVTFVLAVVAALAMTFRVSCTGLVPAEIEACDTACKSNGGVARLYLSGDCECQNGAEFGDLGAEE